MKRTALIRRTPLLRKTPLARGNLSPIQALRIPRVKPERAAQKRRYNEQRDRYLAEHPFDMIWIAVAGMREEDVIATDGFYRRAGVARRVPRSTQVHHRNKNRKDRLTDERWWMATSTDSHENVENHKDWAREEGYLLPIQADADGRWGSGNQALETPALMTSKIK